MELSEIEKALEAFADSHKTPTSHWQTWSWYDEGDQDEIPGLGPVRVVEQFSLGDDDCSGRIGKVFEIGGEHYIKWGWYQSHEGSDWEYGDFTRGTKVTRTVTEWEAP
jgi:hypothetical protein